MDNGIEVNYDILVLLSQLLAQSGRWGDILNMSLTCSFLRANCALLLLTLQHIFVPGERRIESFCRFMLADAPRRYPILSKCSSLEFLTADPLSESVADLLTKALGQSGTLQCVVSFRGFENLILSSPRILRELAAVTCACVHRLEIDVLGAEICPGKRFYSKFLKMLHAPLKEVNLGLPLAGESHAHITYSRELDPLWLLSSLSPSLESIFLTGDVMVSASSVTPVYPRLTHLTVPQRCIPLVRPYIRAFPALHVLHFTYPFFAWADPFLPMHNLSTDTLRAKLSEDLRRDNREDQFVHGSWTSLEEFMGMTLDAYVAGLTCRIPNLHLVSWGGTLEGEVAAICSIVSDARPSLFRLTLRPAHIQYIPALFSQRKEVFKSLLSLELRIDLTRVPFNFMSYFDDVGTALQDLRIVSLQLEFKCRASFTVMNVADPPHCDLNLRNERPSTHCYTLRALSTEDLEGSLKYFLGKVPTLRRVTIAYARCRHNIPHRFITMDLDNMPHVVDRPGRQTDKDWMDGY